MSIEIKIVRKSGWSLNPDDNHVNTVFRLLESNYGHCPTRIEQRNGHDQCPCADYLEHNICHCKLYVKENEKD